MFNRLNQYLQAHKILVPKQFGFKTGKGIEKAIFTVSYNSFTSLNYQELVGAFLLSD